jgi:hypothetical protein
MCKLAGRGQPVASLISHIFDETIKTKCNMAPKGKAMKMKGGKMRWSTNCRAALMLKVGLNDRNYTAMHTHVQWSVHLSALLIT